ncbi:DNA polymerase III PolC-type [Armadillidium nasatum]|uniref:DNA polymerase III PolC-type n=1 Tax=Armadillidium nasatum TaxID=96803 RepID=A0A5N5SQY9_9CRUS|nr:DNA polymerase III PolC-type [Armadillidium nasatum]
MPTIRPSGISTYTTYILNCITTFLLLISTYFIGVLFLEKKEKMDENIGSKQKNINVNSSRSIEVIDIIEDDDETSLCENNIENVRMSSSSLIIFDLETSGLSYDYAEILQLSAVYKEKEFNKYIQPLMDIGYQATNVNKLSLINGVLCCDKNPVESTTLHDGLKDFLEWLKSIPAPRFLSGHNVKNFDCGFLIDSLCQFDLMTEFSQLVIGFIDTLPLCRELCPKTEVHNYQQNTLVNHYLKLSYEEHNALEDVIALQKLISFLKCSDGLLMKHMFSVHSAYENYRKKNLDKKNFPAYYLMIKKKGISTEMAKRFAKANITYKDLLYNYKNGGMDSLKEFLSTPKGTKGFGTKSGKVIEKIFNYFKENNC